jgi:hypothetical protein
LKYYKLPPQNNLAAVTGHIGTTSPFTPSRGGQIKFVPPNGPPPPPPNRRKEIKQANLKIFIDLETIIWTHIDYPAKHSKKKEVE